MTEIRTRFAPSPTGYLHVGGIRTALFAYLVARQTSGKFVLRLEDTDKNREVEGSAEHIVASLRALGIAHDEGPDIGGPYAPYKQSDRLGTYKTWAKQLIEAGRAYADPYKAAEIQAFRETAQKEKRAFRYRDHRPESPSVWDGSTPLRFKSEPKSYTYHDEVMGDITTSPEVVDDFILIKSDGYPTYNFAHIVDDTEMHITHVIRGQEFISSMANYLALYEALGFDMSGAAGGAARGSTQNLQSKTEILGADTATGPAASDANERLAESGFEEKDGRSHPGEDVAAATGPVSQNEQSSPQRSLPIFAHMPHIMNEQGNKKLGKRDGAKDVLDYIRDGYLPETLDSFIATLGWNDGTEQEIFTMDELVEKFSLDRVQKSGARFDEKRLLWMNGQFIRELTLDDLYKRVDSFWPESAVKASEESKKQVLALAQDRLKTLRDLPVLTDYFFAEPTPNLELIASNKQLKQLSPDEITALLKAARTAFDATDPWTAEAIQTTLNQLLETTGQKPAVLFSLIRIATTWAPFSPQLNDTLALLGRDRTLARLARSCDTIR